MVFLNRIGDSMKSRYIIMISILAFTIIMLGSSFAYLKSVEESNSSANVSLTNVNVELVQDVTSVTLNKLYPMTDSEGETNTPTSFAIKNTGGVDANYRVTLVDGALETGASYMKNSDVRYKLTKTVGNGSPQVLGPFTLSDDGVIDEGTINAGTNGNGQTITYQLVMWIDYNANPNGQKISKYITVDGMQLVGLDKSGANFPELADNMIPVYYDTTNSAWKKADSKNLNSTYKWFDYDTKMWANAVTVKETGTQTRDYYINASSGTTIDMSDITTMWVWIPRFKYAIFNGNNGTTSEKMINVIFEHGKDATGTVICSSNDVGVETCEDEKNDSIINNVSTYTHPAFTFGNDELTGIWVSKYEMSTDDSTCNSSPNSTNCNKSLNILVKPNTSSLKYQNIYNLFINIRNMEITGNIHGLVQSSSETSAANNGIITGDSNIIDTHMIKNIEWGAVAYLSHSKYGNSIDVADSTTNNMYGVYNLNNGSSEYLMANEVDSSGNFQVSSAGTWTSSNYPDLKYYDRYSYSASSNGQASLQRGKFGDGTKEVTTNFSSNTGRWYTGDNYLMSALNSWGLRTSIYGLSNTSTGEANESYTSRPVLTVVRDMPWLND